MKQIILYQPEIPANTGNIARTCAITRTRLTLVRPLGFSVSSRMLKRAGLDYWDDVEVEIVDKLEERPHYFFSTKGKQLYTEIDFQEDVPLVFGSESKGLPEEFHEKWPERFYRIPMGASQRSLNLSNAVAIVLYEALRQQGFQGLV